MLLCVCVCVCVCVSVYVHMYSVCDVCMCVFVRICTHVLRRSKTCIEFHVFYFSFREMFFNLLNEILQNHFKTSFDKLLSHLATGPKLKDDDIRSLFFGDYLSGSGSGEGKVYDELTDYNKLTEAMERYVNDLEWYLV